MQINEKLIADIKSGAVGVMPTDTIYGIVCSVFNEEGLYRIYEVKNRDKSKKMINLIGNRGQLPSLGINLNEKQLESLNQVWPGPVSIEFVCDDTLSYLHKGEYCLAVRLPADTNLRRLINETGPVVATSANLAGQLTPSDINVIIEQLPGLDFYIEGPVGDTPSRLARLESDGQITWLNRTY